MAPLHGAKACAKPKPATGTRAANMAHPKQSPRHTPAHEQDDQHTSCQGPFAGPSH